MNSWDDYKILAQIYYNYVKDRIEAYVEDLLDYLRNEIDADQLSTHYVTYQGATNIPSTRSWAVPVSSVLGDHKSAYQLYIYFSPNEIEYGIDNGSGVPRKEHDDESFQSEDEISIQKVVEAYEDRLDTFWRWNEGLIEEPDPVMYDELPWFEAVEKTSPAQEADSFPRPTRNREDLWGAQLRQVVDRQGTGRGRPLRRCCRGPPSDGNVPSDVFV